MKIFAGQEYILQYVINLTMAIFLGGIIGIERKMSNKAAGFRTMILICLGSCLFASVSMLVGSGNGHNTEAISRVIGNIIAGIGFLGAGSIMKNSSTEKARVEGLTTAAAIWVVAGIGILIGLDYHIAAVVTTFFAAMVLFFFSRVERVIMRLIGQDSKNQ